MQRKFRISMLAALLAAGTAAGTAGGWAKETGANFDAGSFSGAFLAARSAEVDNDLAAAIGYYRNALSYDRENQGLMQSLMLALISKGEFDQSLPYASQLKDVPEAERFAHMALAIDAFRKKDYRAADDLLQMSSRADLDRLVNSIMSAWAMAGYDDVDGAIDSLNKLNGPEWFGIFVAYHKALILEQANRDAPARAAYKALVDDMASGGAAPDTYLRGVEAYARYLARMGKKDEALAVLEKSKEFVTGRVTIEALEEAIKSDARVAPLLSSRADGAAEILYNMGAALNRSGGEAFVKLFFQYALALRPNDDSVLLQLGSIAETQNDSELAITYFERIADDSPLKEVAELQLGLNLADLKRHDEAVTHLENVLRKKPDDIRAYLALGGVYASDKNYAEAAKVYERAVERIKEPTKADWNVFYQRGIAYERLKEWDKAEPNFRKSLELFPDQPSVLNYLGYSLVDMGRNLDEGLEMIAKAVEQRPSDGYIVDSLGWAYYRLNRYDDAVRELERAVSLMPNDPVLNDHLGDAYWRVGRKLEATFQWSHARDLDPEPELKEQVLKKLEDGLAPVENPAAVEKTPEPVAPKTELVPANPDRRG
jgi:tetratricopeptide (TPR) repeat protein